MTTQDARSSALEPNVENFSPATNYRRAVDDISEGVSNSWVWLDLARRDILQRYRGSMIGPFWLTLSIAILIAVIGTIHTQLAQHDASEYIPYIAVGLVIWQFIGGTLTSSCTTYIEAEQIMKQSRMPLSQHVFRQVARQFIILGHTLILIPVVLAIFGTPLSWSTLMVIPGLIMLCVTSIWVTFLFGIISARFRDLPQMIAALMQVLFFVTPVFWFPSILGDKAVFVQLSPLYASIDVIRSPLLGNEIAPTSWPVLLIAAVVGGAATFAIFAKFRSRIIFWV